MKKVIVFLALWLLAAPFYGQETPEELRNEEDELAKELQNPLASLISVPVEVRNSKIPLNCWYNYKGKPTFDL